MAFIIPFSIIHDDITITVCWRLKKCLFTIWDDFLRHWKFAVHSWVTCLLRRAERVATLIVLIPSRSLYPIIPLSQRARRPARILYAQILQYKAMHYPDNIFIFWILISFICFSFYQHIHFTRHKRLWLISCSLPG